MKMRIIIILICLGLLFSGCNNQNKEWQTNSLQPALNAISYQSNTQDIVKFKTPELESQVRKLLKKPTSDITELDALKITELDLDSIKVHSLTELAPFKNLKSLRIGSSNISNLDGIEALSNLEKLWLRRNNIEDIHALSKLSHLKELDIAENNIKDFTPLENLTSLVSLGIGDNGGNIGKLTFLKHLSKLKSLYAPFCGITDISDISDLTQLTYLNLFHNSIADITPLKKINKLDYLQLDLNKIVDISVLQHLPKITSVFIDDNPIDKEQLDKFLTITDKDIYTIHFKEQISSDLSPFDFDIQGYRTKDGYHYAAKNITISLDGKVIQKITFKEDELTGYPTGYDKNFGFTAEDMNFDGYKDFRIVQYVPAAPNISYIMWIWNPKTNQFQEDSDLEQILSPEFDQEKKLIYSFTRGSATDHYDDTYQYINGKLTHIKSIATGYVNNEDPENTYYMEYQLLDGKLQLIKKEKIELHS